MADEYWQSLIRDATTHRALVANRAKRGESGPHRVWPSYRELIRDAINACMKLRLTSLAPAEAFHGKSILEKGDLFCHMLMKCRIERAEVRFSAIKQSSMPNDKRAGADFGARLRKLREDRSITLVELAKRVNLTPAAVWHWENRGKVPRSGTLRALSVALGVSPAFFDISPVPEEPEQATRSATSAPSLEDLIRAIEIKGYRVEVSSRRRSKIS